MASFFPGNKDHASPLNMKILHLDGAQFSTLALARLREFAEVELFDCQDQEDLYQHLQINSYEVIITRLGLMLDAKSLTLQPGLRYILSATTGLNHIDITEAECRGIKIISLKGESEFLADIRSTAEHTWGLILALLRQLPGAIKSVAEGHWSRREFLSEELDGKTLGIIGYGRLGKIVSRYGQVFRMNVLVADKSIPVTTEPGVCGVATDELLSKADIVVLLISWSEENAGFMNGARFDLMKSGSWFINTSRGELVDEAALVANLVSGKLRGAALDVLDQDSAWSGRVSGSEKLMAYARANNNLLITPHMGGYGRTSIEKTRDFITDKFISYAKSEKK